MFIIFIITQWRICIFFSMCNITKLSSLCVKGERNLWKKKCMLFVTRLKLFKVWTKRLEPVVSLCNEQSAYFSVFEPVVLLCNEQSAYFSVFKSVIHFQLVSCVWIFHQKIKRRAFITLHNSISEAQFRGADPLTQSKLVPICWPLKDSRLVDLQACRVVPGIEPRISGLRFPRVNCYTIAPNSHPLTYG